MNICLRHEISPTSGEGIDAARSGPSAGHPCVLDIEGKLEPTKKILALGTDPDMGIGWEQATQLDEVEVLVATSAESAKAMLRSDFPGIVVTDMRLSEMDGLRFLEFARELDTDLPVIMLAESGDRPLAMEAMNGGAYDVIEKPFSPAHLFAVVRRALEKRRLTLELKHLRRLHKACPSVPTGLNLSKTVENFERALIAAELERQSGNVARSSQALGVARTTLHDKIRKYGLS